MAKINIEVELDWLIGEEQNQEFEESLRSEIMEAIVKRTSETLATKMEIETKKVLDGKIEEFQEKVNKKMEELMDEFFEAPRDITDRWGNVQRKNVSAKQILSEAADKFFTEKVDEKGEPSTYGAKYTRIEYIVKKAVNNDVTWAVERAVKDAVDKVRENVKTIATKQLGEKLAEVVGLEKII